MTKPLIVQVAIDKPLRQCFDYIWNSEKLGQDPLIGQLVEVPFGRGNLVGVVVQVSHDTALEPAQLKTVTQLAPIPALDPQLMQLMVFASTYYIQGLGETLIPSIPQYWKKPKNWPKLQLALMDQAAISQDSGPHSSSKSAKATGAILTAALNAEQAAALTKLNNQKQDSQKSGLRATLLQGRTGSGKTAVFLNWLANILAEKNAQVLILVPEINLTPQLERSVRAHFPGHTLAVLHSALAEKKRGMAWYEAQIGRAQIILGTRLAVLTPIPHLRAIVVDEEHDTSYKQQEGTRYSARDLAVWRAHNLHIPIVLSSATPSLETWLAARNRRYDLIQLNQRAQGGAMPEIRLIDLKDKNNQSAGAKKIHLSRPLANAIDANLQQQEQSLVLINRRGYAPVLTCLSCGWLSQCAQCSAYLVLHKPGAITAKPILSCHHCGLVKSVPKSCPECGDADIRPIGQGTQKIEDAIGLAWPNARILRIDADSSRRGRGAEDMMQAVHAGEIDIIIGTQMIAKGHDYQNIRVVGVLDADARLYSHDYRAPERLFAQLVQVAGRAGRSDGVEKISQIYIETRHPNAAVFQYLIQHDVDGFLAQLATEREEAQLPPFTFQALIHAEGKVLSKVLVFLAQLKQEAASHFDAEQQVKIYDPVAKSMVRIAGLERAQLVIEANHRNHLQGVLEQIDTFLRGQSQGRISKKDKIRWSIERDPALI
ncbi:primosomal protein N' [Polynucleobacter sp. IMCC 30228]|uniref:replication restart helicase PriA n=1 Tax=Polynucleobacter sp. IMCC 30228 TaxID=2781011 RepID=UPI001F453B4B|nr:primosomal protein N' [Polynucleobacter sp. IMCC 30228]MCE7526303.1 primosomal protein N' [Polynucleobacter sp. IMCC 30228]